MSHIQGTDYVGSMVVFEDGLPKRSDYRRFKVSAVQGNDDYGAMHEVLTRRLRRLIETARGAWPRRPGRSTAERPPGARTDGGELEDKLHRRPPPAKAALCLSASAAAARRWQGPARRRRAGPRRARPERPGRGRLARQAAGGGLRPRPGRPGRRSRATARRSTCCSRPATRRTASRSASTASCAADADDPGRPRRRSPGSARRGARGSSPRWAGSGPSRRPRSTTSSRLAWLPEAVARPSTSTCTPGGPSKAG